MPIDNMGVNRRDFLKMTTAAGAGGMAALAGCSGSKSDGGGGGSDNAGDKLPTYSYLNNPANYNPARHDAINLVGDQLKKVGLNTNVQVFEWGTLYTKITEEFNYSFATWSRGLGIDPGRRMPEQFHSSNTGKGQGNFTGYTNKDLDPKLMKQLQIKDEQKRIDMLFDIQKTLNEDVPMHPIVQMPNIVAYNSDQVSGWTDHIAGYFHFEPMTSVEVNNSKKELRGSWAETSAL